MRARLLKALAASSHIISSPSLACAKRPSSAAIIIASQVLESSVKTWDNGKQIRPALSKHSATVGQRFDARSRIRVMETMMIAFNYAERFAPLLLSIRLSRTFLTDRAFHFSICLSMTSVTRQPLRSELFQSVRERLAKTDS